MLLEDLDEEEMRTAVVDVGKGLVKYQLILAYELPLRARYELLVADLHAVPPGLPLKVLLIVLEVESALYEVAECLDFLDDEF